MRIGEMELMNPAEDEEDRNVQQLNIVATTRVIPDLLILSNIDAS